MINMPRLRAAMDLCIEQLPTLLKIEQDGAVSVTQLLPRVLSQLRALSVYSESGSSVGAEERISESMGYVLQKVHILMMVIGLSGVVPMPSVIIRVTVGVRVVWSPVWLQTELYDTKFCYQLIITITKLVIFYDKHKIFREFLASSERKNSSAPARWCVLSNYLCRTRTVLIFHWPLNAEIRTADSQSD